MIEPGDPDTLEEFLTLSAATRRIRHVPRQLPSIAQLINVSAVDEHLNALIINKIAYDALHLTRFRQSKSTSTRRNSKVVFAVGDFIKYKRRLQATGGTKKSDPFWLGPFKTTAVGENTGNYRLDTPRSGRVHPFLSLRWDRDDTESTRWGDFGFQTREWSPGRDLKFKRGRNQFKSVSWKGWEHPRAAVAPQDR